MSTMWAVSRDNEPVVWCDTENDAFAWRDTENDAFAWLLDHQGQSVWWATTYEGWTIKEIENG